MLSRDFNIVRGDCIAVLRRLDDNSVHAVVTDPPYGLEFMGKSWDGAHGFRRSLNANDATRDDQFGRMSKRAPEYVAGPVFQQFCYAWGREVLRVLKPGGYLIAFGGTRTYHRLVSGLEDAGFEVRDMIAWLYGQGMPKGENVAKTMDKVAGIKFKKTKASGVGFMRADGGRGYNPTKHKLVREGGRSRMAEEHDGQNTALRPCIEPAVLARKPIQFKTVAQNVYQWGTGALNVDATRSRLRADDKPQTIRTKARGADHTFKISHYDAQLTVYDPRGRWPANVSHDGSRAVLRSLPKNKSGVAGRRNKNGAMFDVGEHDEWGGYGDEGSVARFFNAAPFTDVERRTLFKYVPKPSKRERSLGLAAPNEHPTVKPVALMRWLIRLVTPKGGVVVDPFVGSGTTGVAARLEGVTFLGIDQSAEYVAMAKKRAAAFEQYDTTGGADVRPSRSELRRPHRDDPVRVSRKRSVHKRSRRRGA